MPIYEYECEKCGHRVEKIQKFSDPPLETCEKCGGPVHKMQSAPAFQFKGTGWYVTDYAKSGKPGTDEKKTEPTKSESAPAASASSTTSTTSSSSSSESKSKD
ncbi:MAG TPA: FmdB family zinc ribbon protein [Vicinamibacterales bacterium]|jgi:putative FmdB family regulatory protein|nr:FmdB family zinc ribbon protein [Vicinamibacterales bacterium]